MLCTDYWSELNKMQARLVCTLFRGNFIKTFYDSNIHNISNSIDTNNNRNVQDDNSTTNKNSNTNHKNTDMNKNPRRTRRMED